ncbi:MAG: AarF/ABC1/UbiB kinase family protein [Planctomycetes bacterium]|nr:AarF/ABC1/UbiB kinase family protein [Planctomycetota bacterium]
MNALQLVRSVRGLQRVRKILSVLSQHGFGHLVDRMNLGRFVPLRRRRAARASEIETMTIGQRLVAVCNELGPTFVKLGQMATTRPDLVPADIIEDLKALQDHVGPFETEQARAIIVEDLGAPIEELFRSFGSEPWASGSIGQVYRAQTRDGLEVIVKVRRPEVEVTIRRDVFLLKQLADALETHVEETRVYRPRILIDEFEQTLLRELDFTHEASSTTRMAQALSDDCNIRIPKTLWDLSSARVLTLAVVPGVNIGQVLASDDPRFDRPLLASRLADLYLRQFFEVGVYHADPHPGNILVSAPATVALIDFGQVGTVPPELATKLVALLVAATYRETDFMATVLADLNALGTETDPRELARELRILQDKYYGLPLKRLDLMTIFHEATAVMRRNDVVIPRDLVLILKTLSAVMGLVLQLDPEFDLLATFRPRIKKLIRDQVAPGRVARSAGAVAWNILGLLREGPMQLRAGLRRFAQGQWQLNVRHERLSELMSELDRSSNRISFSVVIAAIIVGSSMVVTSDAEMRILSIPLQWTGVLGYLVAALLGLGLLWPIFLSGKLY